MNLRKNNFRSLILANGAGTDCFFVLNWFLKTTWSTIVPKRCGNIRLNWEPQYWKSKPASKQRTLQRNIVRSMSCIDSNISTEN
jgi:hypothetical protein